MDPGLFEIRQETGIVDVPLGVKIAISYCDGIEEVESGHIGIIPFGVGRILPFSWLFFPGQVLPIPGMPQEFFTLYQLLTSQDRHHGIALEFESLVRGVVNILVKHIA